MTDHSDLNLLCRKIFPGWNVALLKEIDGGRSEARVLLVDFVPSPVPLEDPISPQLTSGQYILKIQPISLWSGEQPESSRHEAAVERSQSFSRDHIPTLRFAVESDDVFILLYDIAGNSLAGFVAADVVDAGSLLHYCGLISASLLQSWNANYTVNNSSRVTDTLALWLGYRLSVDEAPSLHSFIAQQTVDRPVFLMGGRVLLNPMWLARHTNLNVPAASVSFNGVIHADLHLGNILVDRTRQHLDRYWLIDFALSKEAPLGFDHAYLELALIMSHLDGAEPQRMLNILEALEAPADSVDSRKVPVQDLGVLNCIVAIRRALNDWQLAHEGSRTDSFAAQLLLSRVAAGLNWTNKPSSDARRRLCLAYAAKAAALYVETFASIEYASLMTEAGSVTSKTIKAVAPEWTEVWDQLGRFDSTRAKFVLLTGRIAPSDEARSLALVPWSAVIDLDPLSNESGLHSCIGQTLSQLRSVQQYGAQSIQVDLQRGTAWMMANGWPSRFEEVPDTFRRWRAKYGDVLRRVFEELRRLTAPLPVKVLILTAAELDADYLRSAIGTIDESLNESSDITVIGQDSFPTEPGIKARYGIGVADFLAALYQLLGGAVEVDEPAVPGGTGFVPVPVDQLRNLNEDIEVLHSRLLHEPASEGEIDSFWRGNPPTWLDLHADADVRRDVGPRLLARVHELLEARGNYTVELQHTPGSGGSTAALRCAWDLRRDFPVGVLRKYSRTTADRIDQLFRLSQRPVLLVAEANVLPQAQREDLFREVARRNVRCVILYVVRSFEDPTSGENDRFKLNDPMENVEAEAFCNAFSSRTNSTRRQRALEELTTSSELRPYRTAFFYGLITYEETFERIDHYVSSYLLPLSVRIRRVMRFVALITRFTQIGVSLAFVKTLLGLEPDSQIELPVALGDSGSRLAVIRGQSVRLLHPIIAEEVLRQELGGYDQWTHGLKDLSLDLISDVRSHLGPDSVEGLHLFATLFIRRDFWTPGVRVRRNFSELLLKIPSPAGQHQVLKTLTEVCPSEPHFWNHLGRHHIYEMKQDFAAAEGYLQKAVELDPFDQIHHHALGMVRRFWIRSQIAEVLRAEVQPTADELLAAISPLLDSAAAEFAAARGLAPEDDHGYITHIQLIVEVLEGLIRLAGDENLQHLSLKRTPLGKWVRNGLVAAEDLLRQVQHLRQQRVPSKFELRCVNGLAALYGHFEALVSSLEQLAGNVEDPDVRRALATAYYSRSGRSWAKMSEGDLRRTQEMMADNLRSDPTNERDIRSWFQSARRLPEFSYIDAIDRLEGWATTSGSVDAFYYLYILHFLRWQAGAERDDQALQSNMELCRQRSIGRRGLSYEWFAKWPTWCPLAHVSELGERKKDQDQEFFENTEPLARVRGTIDSIKGPQAGQVRLGPRTLAFFLPGTKFSESRHLNAVVEFYVGFSYDGLRAWVPEFVTEKGKHGGRGGVLVESKPGMR
jgi:hypothetical protein